MNPMEQLLQELNSAMDNCKAELESIRNDMVQIGETVGLLNEEVLAVSQRMDEKILEFMRVSQKYSLVKRSLQQSNLEDSK